MKEKTMSTKSSRAKRKHDEEPGIYNITKTNGSFKFDRRDFLKLAATASAATWVASCMPASAVEEGTPVVPSTSHPTETNTMVPTRTSTSTPSATPTQTPTATPVMLAGVMNSEGNLWAGPGPSYLWGHILSFNVQLVVIGKTADGAWLQVLVGVADLPYMAGARIIKDGKVPGWVESFLVTITSGSLDDLPVVEIPPTPSPLPNQKPTGKDGITYQYTDDYGGTYTRTLPCGSQIPQGAVCVCNCVAVCSCDGYATATPSCSCNTYGTICTCDVVSYWYPN
jgi:hypothetical protein